MAKKYGGAKTGINFDGFLELARKIAELNESALKTATENALTASKDYVNREIEAAMQSSRYAFVAGQKSSPKNKPATGRALASLQEVAQRPVEWDGTVAKAFMGPNLENAPESVILASNGNPHVRADTRLRNALKVKGAVAKEVSRIQQQEFMKVIAEEMKQ